MSTHGHSYVPIKLYMQFIMKFEYHIILISHEILFYFLTSYKKFKILFSLRTIHRQQQDLTCSLRPQLAKPWAASKANIQQAGPATAAARESRALCAAAALQTTGSLL